MAESFDMFCIVELFGHQRIVGRVTEQVIGGQGFIRVDVPAIPGNDYHGAQQGFTKLFGPSAIYAITPVSEDVAMRAAYSMRVEPISAYELRALPAKRDDNENDEKEE